MIIHWPYLSYFVPIQPIANFLLPDYLICDLWIWFRIVWKGCLTPWQLHTPPPPPTPWHLHHQHHSSLTTMATPLPTQPQSLPPPPPWLPHQYHYHVNSNTITTTKTSSSPPLLITMTTHRSKMYKWELRIKLNKCILPIEHVSEWDCSVCLTLSLF